MAIYRIARAIGDGLRENREGEFSSFDAEESPRAPMVGLCGKTLPCCLVSCWLGKVSMLARTADRANVNVQLVGWRSAPARATSSFSSGEDGHHDVQCMSIITSDSHHCAVFVGQMRPHPATTRRRGARDLKLACSGGAEEKALGSHVRLTVPKSRY